MTMVMDMNLVVVRITTTIMKTLTLRYEKEDYGQDEEVMMSSLILSLLLVAMTVVQVPMLVLGRKQVPMLRSQNPKPQTVAANRVEVGASALQASWQARPSRQRWLLDWRLSWQPGFLW